MGLLWQFWQTAQQWDTPSKVAFVLACGLLVVVGGAMLTVDGNTRTPTIVGFVGLLFVLQMIVLWGNRHMVTPYTTAQRAFMAGDFVRACAALEAWLMPTPENLASLAHKHNDGVVLLGNVYRQLGDLAHSETLLTHAVTTRPHSHFAWYGLGRTQLAMGKYQESLTSIKKSLSQGAPSVIQFDIGHVSVRLGDAVAAQEHLQAVFASLNEAHRQLMAQWWLHQAAQMPAPSQALLVAGLPFWQEEIKRFAGTPYAQALVQDVDALNRLIQEV